MRLQPEVLKLKRGSPVKMGVDAQNLSNCRAKRGEGGFLRQREIRGDVNLNCVWEPKAKDKRRVSHFTVMAGVATLVDDCMS